MSFIASPAGFADFSKMVLSLWFRVPQATITAAMAAYTHAPDIPFNGIVPLMTFGPAVKWKRSAFRSVTTGSLTLHRQAWDNTPCAWVDEDGSPYTVAKGGTEYYFTGTEYDIEPSYIGIDCRTHSPILSVHIQTLEHATTLDGLGMNIVNADVPSHTDWYPPYPYYGADGEITCGNFPGRDANDNVIPERFYQVTNHYRSMTPVLLGGVPEAFRTMTDLRDELGRFNNAMSTFETSIEPDRWHHLLLSVDLTFPVSTQGIVIDAEFPSVPLPPGAVGSYCKMWMSYDDKNLTEKKLSYYWPDGFGDPNALITPNAWRAYMAVKNDYFVNPPAFNDLRGNIVQHVGVDYPGPTFEFAPSPIRTSGNNLGLPACEPYANQILPVEMAELQVFTGVTLDTGVVANRRAFIDPDGVPVPPENAEELLKQKPEVLLHGSGDWIAGNDTGVPADALNPTGAIIAYSPEPSLHGPQGGAI